MQRRPSFCPAPSRLAAAFAAAPGSTGAVTGFRGGGVLGAVAVVVTSDFAAFFGAKKSEIMLRLDAILTPGRSNTGRVWCLRELTGVCNNSKALVRIPASVISIEEQEPINRGAN